MYPVVPGATHAIVEHLAARAPSDKSLDPRRVRAGIRLAATRAPPLWLEHRLCAPLPPRLLCQGPKAPRRPHVTGPFYALTPIAKVPDGQHEGVAPT